MCIRLWVLLLDTITNEEQINFQIKKQERSSLLKFILSIILSCLFTINAILFYVLGYFFNSEVLLLFFAVNVLAHIFVMPFIFTTALITHNFRFTYLLTIINIVLFSIVEVIGVFFSSLSVSTFELPFDEKLYQVLLPILPLVLTFPIAITLIIDRKTFFVWTGFSSKTDKYLNNADKVYRKVNFVIFIITFFFANLASFNPYFIPIPVWTYYIPYYAWFFLAELPRTLITKFKISKGVSL